MLALLTACASTAPGSHGDAPAQQFTASAAPASTPASAAATATPGPAHFTAAAIDKMSESLLEDTLRPGDKIDLESSRAHEDLWVRVRKGFAMPALDGDLVAKAEQWYSQRPDYVQRMTERGSRYLYHIVEEVEKRGMPTELALLPFIESAYNPQAVSSAKASGMWQFVPATGREYALKQNVFRDDRRDVLASTQAALDYLEKLHTMFGDWHLALAAYNWGQGNVQRAITRNQKANRPTDYESLGMPMETRYYVPKLQAVKNIIDRPEAYGLTLPALANHPYFLGVKVDRDMDVDVAASLAGISVDEFKLYNPQMNKPVILAAGTPQLLLPYENASQFVRKLAAFKGPLASWTAWTAPRTLKSADAAKLVGMNEPALREINKIPPRMLIKKGSTLLVPRGIQRKDDVPEQIADNAVINLAPELVLKRISFKVRKGETIARLAQRYRVTPQQLAQWNKIEVGAGLHAGQTLVAYVSQPVRDVSQRTASAGKPAKSAAKRSSRSGRGSPIAMASRSEAMARQPLSR
jgi:membrane-bound lytic murein transglycosylase D